MRRFATGLVCLLLLASTARAEEDPGIPAPQTATAVQAESRSATSGFVEFQIEGRGIHRPGLVADGYIQHDFTKAFALSGFLLVSDTWAQAYGGPIFTPVDWFSFGLNAGVQTDSSGILPRYALCLWTGTERLNFSGYLEVDNDVFRGNDATLWYDVILKGKVNDWFTAGIKDRRTVGLGPLVEFTAPVPKVPLVFWGAYTPWNPETYDTVDWGRFMVGLLAKL